MKKLFVTFLIVLTVSMCAMSFAGCSNATTYTYEEMQPMKVYYNGEDKSIEFATNASAQNLVKNIEQLFKDCTIKVSTDNIKISYSNNETTWKYTKQDYRLMVDMSDYTKFINSAISTTTSYDNYSIYFIKDENKLYFIIDTTVTSNKDTVRNVMTIVFKK